MLDSVEKTMRREKFDSLLFSSMTKTKGSKKTKGKKEVKRAKSKKASKLIGGIKKHKNKGECHHYGNKGHWKRNCKVYLDTLKEKKPRKALYSSMIMIEINLYTLCTFEWVLVTRYGSPII